MTEKTHIPGFLTKTFEIFSSPDFADSCGWGINGDTIVIRKIEQFSKQVLPNYFKHSNFQSFVRQLNMYDFRKTVQDPNHGEFLHPNFKKGHPELLKLIKRKASSKHLVEHGGNPGEPSVKKSSKSAKAQASSSSAASKSVIDNEQVLLGNPYSDGLPSNLLRLDSNTSVNSWNSLDFHSGGLLEGSLGAGDAIPNASYLLDQGGGDLSRMNSLVSSALSQYHEPLLGAKSQVMTETGALLAELHEQRVSRERYEKSIENRLGHVEQENDILKSLFLESHQKNIMMQERMDRLMKSLYQLLMGGPGVNQQQLLNDITSTVTNYNTNGGGRDKLMIEDSSRGGAAGGREIIRNLNSVGEMSTYDITNLRRLPSLDLTGLSQPSADLYNSLLSAAQEGGGGGGAGPYGVMNSNSGGSSSSGGGLTAGGLAGGGLVRLTSMDGMELSRQGNSFEYAASFVTAPNQSVRYIPSFDASYVGQDNAVQLDLPTTLSSGHSTTSSASYPMSDRVTFLSEHSTPPLDESSESATKRRKVVELSSEPAAAASLPLGPVDSSLDVDSAARDFLDKLNKNQEVTLQRLDSLENTLSSLLESETEEKLLQRNSFAS